MASEKPADRAADRPSNHRPSKKVKFSQQVQVAEYHAVSAQETVTFHLLSATTADELEREIASGGIPFKCEFYNQVRSLPAAAGSAASRDSSANAQQVRQQQLSCKQHKQLPVQFRSSIDSIYDIHANASSL